MSDKTRICVGAFAGAFGVQGEVRLKSYCAIPEAIADYGVLTDESGAKTYEFVIARGIKNGFAVRVQGVVTKEQADLLNNVEVFATRDQLPNLPDDEFYHSDLVGLTVVDTGGTKLGTVRAVQNYGAGDVLDVATPEGTELMLPFTRAIVPTVDLASGRLVADPPEAA